ncbi:MAG: nucleotidyltransferase domain-containing protein [Rhodocyclales bacterium]|nr:nucleotidyltransferase domain-containing protein [Rhodocyclales bacterium]
MRLNQGQIESIKQTVQAIAGEDARAIIFGSRLHDETKGGDLDLLVQADQHITLLQRARIKMLLEQSLALPVDVITHQRHAPTTPFQQIAIKNGVSL